MESRHDFFLGTSKNNSDLHWGQTTSAQLLVLLIVLDTVVVNDICRLPLGDSSRWLCQAFFSCFFFFFFLISGRSWPILALYWSRTPLAALGAVLLGPAHNWWRGHQRAVHPDPQGRRHTERGCPLEQPLTVKTPVNEAAPSLSINSNDGGGVI